MFVWYMMFLFKMLTAYISHSDISFLPGCVVSSNFGVTLVVSSKGKIVTASEVLASGPQPCPTMETIIVTLMHLALYSEKIEQQVYLCCFFQCVWIKHYIQGKEGC